MKETILELEKISKNFNDLKVLTDINFKVFKGDIIAILGKSGEGKTTLLRTINNLIEPNGGNIYFKKRLIERKNKEIRKFRTKIGFVFQHFNLVSNLTVLQNVMLGPLKAKKIPKKEVKELALNKIKLVEMLDKIDSYPNNLSGGQKQRVGIARALAMEPEIILFDEPTSALDPSLVGEVMKIIKKLSFEGITMIIVTHEIAFIRSIANRILFLSEGKVKYDLKTDEFFNSKESTINDYLNIFVYDN